MQYGTAAGVVRFDQSFKLCQKLLQLTIALFAIVNCLEGVACGGVLVFLNDDNLLIVNTMVSKMSLLTETRLSWAEPLNCLFRYLKNT